MLCACLDEPPFRGDEVMGTFAFTAEPWVLDCELADVAKDRFDFTGTFSRFRDGGEAFFTLNGVETPAEFDGQVVRTERAAARRFPECECGDRTSLHEMLAVALLSKSQDEALEGSCPPDALDGGIPSGGGIRRPASTERGFDAVRACGLLVDTVIPETEANCSPVCQRCRLTYRVRGDRR